MKILLILCVALCVSGCESLRNRSAPATVNKAVAQACQTDVPERPVFPADTLIGDEDPWTIGVTLWADREAREAYEIAVRTRLIGCVKQ